MTMPDEATTLEEHLITEEDSSESQGTQEEAGTGSLFSAGSEATEEAALDAAGNDSAVDGGVATVAEAAVETLESAGLEQIVAEPGLESEARSPVLDARSFDSGYLVDPEIEGFEFDTLGDGDDSYSHDDDFEIDDDRYFGYPVEDDDEGGDLDFDFDEDDFSFLDDDDSENDYVFESDEDEDAFEIPDFDGLEGDDLYGSELDDLELDADGVYADELEEDLSFDDEPSQFSKPEIRDALPDGLQRVYDQQVRGVEKLHRQVSEGKAALDGIESVLVGIQNGDQGAVAALDRILGLVGSSLGQISGSSVYGVPSQGFVNPSVPMGLPSSPVPNELEQRLFQLENRLVQTERESVRRVWSADAGQRLSRSIFEAKGIRIPPEALYDAQAVLPPNPTIDQVLDAVGQTNFLVYKQAIEGRKTRDSAPPSARLGRSKAGVGTGSIVDVLNDPIAWRQHYESTRG
jgi:hypothetical protein